MSMWDFRNQSTQHDTDGSNTAAGFVDGYQPFYNADTLSSKRNVVATEKGWVRRQNYTDVHGRVRVKEEVVVAAHPGPQGTGAGGGYSNSSYLGSPDISILQLNDADYLTSELVTVYVTFNEPLVTTANVTLVATERDGVTTANFTSNTTNTPAGVAKFYPFGANNTLVFTSDATLSAGNWKIRAQDLVIEGAGGTLTSWNAPDFEAADLTIPAPVSNTLMSSTGAVLANGEFVVA